MNDKERLALIEKQLKVMPSTPGVYIIRDVEGKVIYVGKAKNLVTRLRTHFTKSNEFSKSRVIRERGASIEAHQVNTENEALLLEYNMIQEHQPPLNEKWKDGKTYPYLEVTLGEVFPRFFLTRERNNEESLYLGPFSDVGAVKRSLKFVLNLFPVADCKNEIHLGDAEGWAKTCIRRRTNQCMKPCEIEVNEEEYRENVDQVIDFLEGRLPDVIQKATEKMKKASKELKFEQAAKYRDITKSIKRTMERQQVFLEGIEDCYIIVQEKNNSETCITVQKIEDERVIRRDSNSLNNEEFEEQAVDFISNFLINVLQIHEQTTVRNVIIDNSIVKGIDTLLTDFGFNVIQAASPEQIQLIEMARNHAKHHLQRRLLIRKDRGLPSSRVEDLRLILDMDLPPFIIDTFDVSTLMGNNNVASCVRFQNGKPLKKGYRQFKIRTVDQQDDFASMEEAVFRRYRDVKDGKDPKGLQIPDLIVIDGGFEQLKRGINALKRNDLDIPIIGLAKREEEIYLPGVKDPLNEDINRLGMLLIRACRDEAHRFAVKYQRKLRQKQGLHSILDDIPNIGPKRKQKLLKHYKTVASIARESSETLSEKIGISQELASQVIDASRKFNTNLQMTEKRRFSKKNS